MATIQHLYRVIIYVADMAQQVAFYRDVLGIAVNYPQVEDYRNEYWVELATGAVPLTLHSGGEKGADKHAAKIVFEVDDIHAMREKVMAQGIALTTIEQVAPGIVSCTGRDPEGNLFSLDHHEHP